MRAEDKIYFMVVTIFQNATIDVNFEVYKYKRAALETMAHNLKTYIQDPDFYKVYKKPYLPNPKFNQEYTLDYFSGKTINVRIKSANIIEDDYCRFSELTLEDIKKAAL